MSSIGGKKNQDGGKIAVDFWIFWGVIVICGSYFLQNLVSLDADSDFRKFFSIWGSSRYMRVTLYAVFTVYNMNLFYRNENIISFIISRNLRFYTNFLVILASESYGGNICPLLFKAFIKGSRSWSNASIFFAKTSDSTNKFF